MNANSCEIPVLEARVIERHIQEQTMITTCTNASEIKSISEIEYTPVKPLAKAESIRVLKSAESAESGESAEKVLKVLKTKKTNQTNDKAVDSTEKKITRLEHQEIIFKFFKDLSDPVSIVNHEDSKKNLMQTSGNVMLLNQKNHLDYINLSIKYGFPAILVSLLNYSIEQVNGQKDKTSENKEIEKFFSIANTCFSITRSYSNYSIKFCHEFHTLDGIRTSFQYLTHEYFVNIYKLIRIVVGCLLNLSRAYDSFTYKWLELSSVQVILDLTERYKQHDEFRMSAYILLASIVNDEDIDTLPDLKLIIPEIISLIGKCATMIEKNIGVKRMNIQLNEDSSEVGEVCRINFAKTVWHLVELADCLYHMAVNDSIKYDIYFTYEMSVHLRKIIFNGTLVEVTHSLKLLNQLCFDKRVAEHVLKDAEMCQKLEDLSNDAYRPIKMIAEGILWLLGNKSGTKITSSRARIKEKEKVNTAASPASQAEDQHIMISYNSKSREDCLKIKSFLEKIGHKVWIDVDQIHGSSCEAMASAIENAKVVLMCMTEKYKQSSNCRAEAEYSFQLNKPIVPLILQKGYRADGWLGLILGSKIFVDFYKYQIDDSLQRIKKEIESYSSISKLDSATSDKPIKIIEVNTPSPKSKIESWTQLDVNNWLKLKEIHQAIIRSISPCEGKILVQLHDMQRTSPEFFYSSLTYDEKIPIRFIAAFACELKELLN